MLTDLAHENPGVFPKRTEDKQFSNSNSMICTEFVLEKNPRRLGHPP
jgi:hypothetical protein